MTRSTNTVDLLKLNYANIEISHNLGSSFRHVKKVKCFLGRAETRIVNKSSRKMMPHVAATSLCSKTRKTFKGLQTAVARTYGSIQQTAQVGTLPKQFEIMQSSWSIRSLR